MQPSLKVPYLLRDRRLASLASRRTGCTAWPNGLGGIPTSGMGFRVTSTWRSTAAAPILASLLIAWNLVLRPSVCPRLQNRVAVPSIPRNSRVTPTQESHRPRTASASDMSGPEHRLNLATSARGKGFPAEPADRLGSGASKAARSGVAFARWEELLGMRPPLFGRYC